ncbi:hypothetical protein [Streptomyces durmitorensis]|uniref:hypothetical protein n=1 Tax=Streptomyces durmitorensis TaxID=319947 RepID=UPI0031DA6E88
MEPPPATARSQRVSWVSRWVLVVALAVLGLSVVLWLYRTKVQDRRAGESGASVPR